MGLGLVLLGAEDTEVPNKSSCTFLIRKVQWAMLATSVMFCCLASGRLVGWVVRTFHKRVLSHLSPVMARHTLFIFFILIIPSSEKQAEDHQGR